MTNTTQVIQDDLAAILRALDLGDNARPVSPHEVVQQEVLPALNECRRVKATLAQVEHLCCEREAELEANGALWLGGHPQERTYHAATSHFLMDLRRVLDGGTR